MLLADYSTLCQIAFSVMQSPHALPILLTPGETAALYQFRPRQATRLIRFLPSPEPGPFERALPYPSNRRWPRILLAAQDDLRLE